MSRNESVPARFGLNCEVGVVREGGEVNVTRGQSEVGGVNVRGGEANATRGMLEEGVAKEGGAEERGGTCAMCSEDGLAPARLGLNGIIEAVARVIERGGEVYVT